MNPFTLRLEIPGLTPMNSADNLHWRKRYRAKVHWEHAVWAAIHQAQWSGDPMMNWGILPLSLARVVITRRSSGREPDFENLAQSGKWLLDQLVKNRPQILVDDSPAIIGQPEYRWEKCKRKDQAMIVEVSELTAEGCRIVSETLSTDGGPGVPGEG